MQPVAFTRQQHNGVRTYLFGRDVAWPEDDRVRVDVAIRSPVYAPESRTVLNRTT